VTFDFWQTLYTEGPQQQRRRQLRCQYARDFFLGQGAEVSPAKLKYAFEILQHQLDHLRKVNHRSSSAEDLGEQLAEIVGVRLESSQAVRLGEAISWAGREAPPVPVEGAREVLAGLRGRAKLALISDTGFTLGPDLYAVMEADGIAGLLDHFTFSDQTGTTKPEVRQFHYTLHRLGCRAEQAVHVGDIEHSDIAGARQAGMRAIRILHPDADPATQAEAAVPSVRDVPEVLRRWGLAL
jgi:putative hydrolase of the HAD superfamily